MPGSGSGANPNLAPIKSTDLDAGLEWYFAPRSLVSADVFYMDLHDYVSYGTVTQSFTQFDKQGAYQAPYLITVPINSTGRVEGAEFEWEQPLIWNFGVSANYTYADGKQTSNVVAGDDRLVGTSKSTFNVIGYYETGHFSARVAYNYRSAFYSGLDQLNRVLAGSDRHLGSIARLHGERSLRRDARRHEPQQPDAQVLRAQPRPAARLLQERLAVLPELPLQNVGIAQVSSGRTGPQRPVRSAPELRGAGS